MRIKRAFAHTSQLSDLVQRGSVVAIRRQVRRQRHHRYVPQREKALSMMYLDQWRGQAVPGSMGSVVATGVNRLEHKVGAVPWKVQFSPRNVHFSTTVTDSY